MAPSRDIATHFNTIEHLRYIIDGGYVQVSLYHEYIFMLSSGLYRCGENLKRVFSSPMIQHFLNGTPMRELHSENIIYQKGRCNFFLYLSNHFIIQWLF